MNCSDDADAAAAADDDADDADAADAADDDVGIDDADGER